MSLRRFFASLDAISGDHFSITGSDARHICTVLRMGKGDRISLITSDGRECTGVLTSVSPTKVSGTISSVAQSDTEPRVQITLIQSLPKGDKMDLVVQKCVEIGVSEIIPAVSERSVVRLGPDRAERRVARWRRISEEASKQCGRSLIPQISDVVSFADAVSSVPRDALKLIPFELERDRTLKTELEQARPEKVVLCIGPEGGFAEAEIDVAQSQGFTPVTLGPRILRTETAGLVVATCILYHMDELG